MEYDPLVTNVLKGATIESLGRIMDEGRSHTRPGEIRWKHLRMYIASSYTSIHLRNDGPTIHKTKGLDIATSQATSSGMTDMPWNKGLT